MILFFLLLNTFSQAHESFFSDLEKIKAKSPSLKSEEERLHSASENWFSKKMFWTPSISAGGGRSILNLPSQPLTNQDYDYWRTDLTWNLFKGGGDLHAQAAAESNFEAQELKIQDANLKLEVTAATFIFQSLYLNDVLLATRDLVKLREESHRVVVEKYHQGKAPLQEVMKSEVDKAQQQTRLRNLEIQQLEVLTQWKSLINEPMETKKWPFPAAQKISRFPSHPTPEVKRLQQLTLATESLWKSSQSTHWPSVDFSTSYQEFPLKDRANQQWSTSLTVTIPLWSRYETSANIAATYADFITTQNQLEDARRVESAQRDVLQQKLELTRQNLLDARVNLEKSKRLYQDMLKSFRYGRMSMNELLIEQNRLIDSELSLSQGQQDFHKILLESCAVLGLLARTCLQ